MFSVFFSKLNINIFRIENRLKIKSLPILWINKSDIFGSVYSLQGIVETMQKSLNLIKTGGSESMYSLGGGFGAHPPSKRPEIKVIWLKCMFLARFFKASSKKNK